MKALYFILFLAISSTPACSRFTASGRRERAYAKYVHKSKADHAKRQARIRKEKARIPNPGEEQSAPREMAQTQEGPQAAPRESDSQ